MSGYERSPPKTSPYSSSIGPLRYERSPVRMDSSSSVGSPRYERSPPRMESSSSIGSSRYERSPSRMESSSSVRSSRYERSPSRMESSSSIGSSRQERSPRSSRMNSSIRTSSYERDMEGEIERIRQIETKRAKEEILIEKNTESMIKNITDNNSKFLKDVNLGQPNDIINPYSETYDFNKIFGFNKIFDHFLNTIFVNTSFIPTYQESMFFMDSADWENMIFPIYIFRNLLLLIKLYDFELRNDTRNKLRNINYYYIVNNIRYIVKYKRKIEKDKQRGGRTTDFVVRSYREHENNILLSSEALQKFNINVFWRHDCNDIFDIIFYMFKNSKILNTSNSPKDIKKLFSMTKNNVEDMYNYIMEKYQPKYLNYETIKHGLMIGLDFTIDIVDKYNISNIVYGAITSLGGNSREHLDYFLSDINIELSDPVKSQIYYASCTKSDRCRKDLWQINNRYAELTIDRLILNNKFSTFSSGDYDKIISFAKEHNKMGPTANKIAKKLEDAKLRQYPRAKFLGIF